MIEPRSVVFGEFKHDFTIVHNLFKGVMRLDIGSQNSLSVVDLLNAVPDCKNQILGSYSIGIIAVFLDKWYPKHQSVSILKSIAVFDDFTVALFTVASIADWEREVIALCNSGQTQAQRIGVSILNALESSPYQKMFDHLIKVRRADGTFSLRLHDQGY